MAHQNSLKVVLIVLFTQCTAEAAAEFGPGEAAAPSQTVRADFKVLF